MVPGYFFQSFFALHGTLLLIVTLIVTRYQEVGNGFKVNGGIPFWGEYLRLHPE
jgi:hypothetical protein